MSIPAIKAAVSLPQLISEWVKLRQVGTEHLGLCPFHSEKTPSLRVHAEFYHCFGCGAGGDAIDFVARIEGVSKGRALRILSDRTGIPLDGSKRRTPIQRAGDRQDLDFALWWHGRQVTALSRQLTAYCVYATEDECEDLGGVLRQLRGLDRQAIVGAARRLGTAEDWREWERERPIEKSLAESRLEWVREVLKRDMEYSQSLDVKLDPDTFIQMFGAEAFRARLEAAVLVPEWE